MQRRQIALFNERRIIGLQTRRQGQGKQCVAIFGILGQSRVRKMFGPPNRGHEMLPQRRIGRQLRTFGEGFIILVKLCLQHPQPVELGE